MSGFKFEAWPTDYRTITQHFGANPQNYAQFGLPGHEGVDIRAPSGSNIYAVAPGTVTKVHRLAGEHNYGIHVRVSHQDGYQTTYAHLQEAHVEKGNEVNAGQLLGLADNTGNSFGSHLHLTLKKAGTKFENWPRNIIDPTYFLLPLLSWHEPSGPFVGGWVLSVAITIKGQLAQVHPDGATLRISPTENEFIPGGTILKVQAPPQGDYVAVQVAQTAVQLDTPALPSTPAPEPPPSIATLEGWAWHKFLKMTGQQATIDNRHGINLRQEADSDAKNLGVLRAGSTVSVLGAKTNGYFPVKARRVDFIGATVLPLPPPLPDKLTELPDDIVLGWAESAFLQTDGRSQAITGYRQTQLRNKPSKDGELTGIVLGHTAVTLAGQQKNNFIPILVDQTNFAHLTVPRPEVVYPEPFTTLPTPPEPNLPPHQTKRGWVLTSELTVEEDTAVSPQFGLHLRQAPYRHSTIIGFIPAQTVMVVPSGPVGEFTPVRVDETVVQPPVDELSLTNPDPSPLGNARIGLHASADPPISDAEHAEFAAMRPGLIKVLSFHSPESITRLKNSHPQAAWILRAFLSFGGRNISPQQFFNDTESDVRRSLNALRGKQLVVELHNEPNLRAEGLYSSWQNGRSFNDWWLELLTQYRAAFPTVKFIYPGLSPGSSVSGIKQDHIQFIENSREAVEASDGLGIHLYWSTVYPMQKSLDVLDDYISRFRNKPIWVTEASNNKTGRTSGQKAHEYLQFWDALQKRPIVQGVTYFVASASDSAFAEETWIGKGIGKIIGQR